MDNLNEDNFNFINPRISFVVVLGTRPEVIKMTPIIRKLRNASWASVHVVATGQQDNLLAEALDEFRLHADTKFEYDAECKTPAQMMKRLTEKFELLFADLNPTCVIAQGDTTSVYAASVVAFYNKIPFVHVEAGLRTPSVQSPFPEEFHRRSIAIATTLHCAPTSNAAENLLRENVEADRIIMSGNTVIDTLLETAASRPALPADFPKMRTIVLTAHRRENFGMPLRDAFIAIRAFVDVIPDIAVYFPLHPNPNARVAALEILSDHPRIRLVEPLSYRSMVAVLQNAWCIVTDSGGIQEEAPALGRPVFVLRETTERPEAVSTGVVEIVGTNRERVYSALSELNQDPAKYAKMARAVFPYGDGHASQRIVDALHHYFMAHRPVADVIPFSRAS